MRRGLAHSFRLLPNLRSRHSVTGAAEVRPVVVARAPLRARDVDCDAGIDRDPLVHDVTTPRKRPARRRGRGTAAPQLTSSSTSRTAYAETKRWLIAQHGPVCAYCGRRVTPGSVTLDHVTPRRGQTAYDRRDNLVLACEDCNGAKADMPILAFLLRKRERAAVLLRYGAHLSPMLVDLVRGLVPAGGELPRVKERFDDLIDDGESPYHESPYRD